MTRNNKSIVLFMSLWLLVALYLIFSGNKDWAIRGYIIFAGSVFGIVYAIYFSKKK